MTAPVPNPLPDRARAWAEAHAPHSVVAVTAVGGGITGTKTSYGLLHRDFHFGNMLWRNDTVTGLIDWAETSWGPPDLDVAHAGSDFAMLQTTADAASFRAAYVQEGGQLDPDPDAARFWAVSDILGFLPDPAHILPAVLATTFGS